MQGCETCHRLFQQDVLRLQVTVNQMSFVQEAQRIQELLCEDTDKSRTQPSELVLFDKLVEVDTE